jgi:hypothetical protein
MRVIESYVRTGSQKATAHELGIALSTVKNELSSLYARLDVDGAMQAVAALGWIALPGAGPSPCGWIAYCSRPRGHSGQHGGFRAFVAMP